MRQVDGYPLWIGTARDARDIRGVLDAGIEAVVDLAVDEPAATLLTRELVYLRFPIVDGGGNPGWLLRAAVTVVVELVRSRVPTLVACGAGMSRSPCLVAAALAAVEGRPIAAILDTMTGPVDVSPGLHRELAECLEPRSGECR